MVVCTFDGGSSATRRRERLQGLTTRARGALLLPCAMLSGEAGSGSGEAGSGSGEFASGSGEFASGSGEASSGSGEDDASGDMEIGDVPSPFVPPLPPLPLPPSLQPLLALLPPPPV